MSSTTPVSDPPDIFMWRRLEPNLTTSGYLTADKLAELMALGVEHVVNLALDSHERALANEAELLRDLGIGYTHIPVDFDIPTDTDFTTFRKTLKEYQGRCVHIHCIANLRVSAFLYRYRVQCLNWNASLALTDMDAIWRPGGAWAAFVGDDASRSADHRYAGRDYQP